MLHHLADPGAGLRALRSVLKPDGVIYLMVYAPYGRTGIYILQEYCRRLAIGTSAGEIDDLVVVQRIDVNERVEKDGESRPFKLTDAGNKDLTKIQVWYDTAGFLHDARVSIFGQK